MVNRLKRGTPTEYRPGVWRYVVTSYRLAIQLKIIEYKNQYSNAFFFQTHFRMNMNMALLGNSIEYKYEQLNLEFQKRPKNN